MNTTIKYIVLGIAALYGANVYADRLVNDEKTYPPFYFGIKTSMGFYMECADGLEVKNTENGELYRLFCTDLFTYTSDEFDDDNGSGQVYNRESIAETSFYTEMQKAQLQSLFDHVYTQAFNDDYSVKNEMYANIFGLAIWEIANDTADNLSLRNGNLYTTACAITDETRELRSARVAQAETLDMLDSWFDAIINDNWAAIGYEENHVNLTLFMAEGGRDVSQTFIGVVAVAPEPATMLIFGLGIAGLGLTRIRKQK